MDSVKLSVPSVVALNTEGMPFSTVVFLQQVENGLKTLDTNVVYKDAVSVSLPQPTISAISAQGQGFSVSNINLASADDYATLVSDCKAMLQTVLQQQETLNNLLKQLKGTS